MKPASRRAGRSVLENAGDGRDVILNQQHRIPVSLGALRSYLERVQGALRIRRMKLNVCLVDDGTMRRLNRKFRGMRKTTDVLSFPWRNGVHEVSGSGNDAGVSTRRGDAEFRNFLGDIVISTEEAARNARREGHEVGREIDWLILHGTLHLLGYDHETDDGEMVALELRLREKLEVDGNGRRRNHFLKAAKQ